MRRKYLTAVELDQVIRLKQAGASWLNIEKMTSIARRSAKRAYEEWERSKSTDELQEARIDVARDEFRKHISHLIAIAGYLVKGLSVPTSGKERKESEELLRQLWSREDLTGYKSDERRTLRHNLMLFKALQNHSREKVRWQALEDWKKAWDRCVSVLTRLSEQCEQLMTNILNQKPVLSREIDKGKMEKVTQPALVEAVLKVVWSAIIDGKPEEACDRITSPKLHDRRTLVTFVDRTGTPLFEFPIADGRMAEEVISACVWAINNLCRGEDAQLIQEALSAVSTMRKAQRELEDMLDPLSLTPLILRTRCELCPV